VTRRRLQSLERLKKLLATHDKAVRDAILLAVRNKRINVTELVAAIESRDTGRVITIAGITRADMFPLDQALVAAYSQGAGTIAAAAPAFAAQFGFNGRAVRAEAWARDHVGGLVTNIVEEQEQALRDVITRQLSEGRNPRAIANQISGKVVNGGRQGGIVGLSGPQTQYLQNARSELEGLDANYFTRKLRDRRFDSIVQRAIDTKTPLSQVDVNRISDRYSDRLLAQRAEVIARTESITALRAGRHEGILQAVDQGAINPQATTRVWDATLDSRTRPDHVAAHGQSVVGMTEPFVLSDGSQLLYPGDTSLGASAAQTISCRCTQLYFISWLAG
jgi:hypothetical protein